MKTKSFLILCILIMRLSAMSQVKIGDNATTINSNSLLELETTNKGFVLPRVSITDVSSSAPLLAGLLTGTIVYNTNSGITGGSGVGIYYWDGSKWNFLANTTITGNYWSLTGNSGTNASTNFIGTTDAKDFVVRTNNVERMHILGATVGSSQVGWIGMGISTTPKSALDVAGNYSGKNVITIQNTSTTGFSSVDMLDNAGNLATTFGFANSGTGTAFTGKAYLNGYGNDFLFTRGSSFDLIMKGSNGYIGLNTSTPSERLHVVGNFYLTGAFMPGGNAGTSGYILTSAGANTAPTWNNINGLSWNLIGNSGTNASTNFIGTTDAVDFIARSNNIERFRITSAGNVGIGLTNPSYKLAILSASNPLYLSGVQATAAFSTDSLLTIYNGVVKKAPYSAITSATTNTLNISGNTLTSTVNGIAAASNAVSGVNNTSSANTLSTTVNGVTGTTVPIINSNNKTWTQTGGLTTTVNGVASNVTPASGTVNNILGYDASGNPVYQTLSGAISGVTSNTLNLSGNTLTSTVNGVAAISNAVGGVNNTSSANTLSTTVNGVTSTTVPIINSNTKTWTQAGGLTTTVNGVSSNVTPASGTVTNILGYNSSGTPVYQTLTNVSLSTTWNLLGNSGTNYATNFLGTTNNVSMRFRTNNIQRMIIDSIGRVGIGLSNPSYALSVLSASNPLYLSGVQATAAFSTDSILTINAGVVKKAPYSDLTSATTNTLNISGNTLTSTVNGIVAASNAVTGVNNTSSANTLSTTVNGVTGTTVPIINSNNKTWTQDGGLTTTVNGVASNVTPASGTINNILGYDASGNPVYQTFSGAISGVTSNTLNLSGNTLTSTVNGIVATSNAVSLVNNTSSANTLSTTVNGVTSTTVPIINSNTKTWTQAAGLTTTVNGIASNVKPASGTVSNILGYSASGAPVYQSLNSINLTTAWNLTGNSGTSYANNFLGTIDNVSLRFRTNNTERVYIDSSTGYLGVGTSSPAARLHVREDVSNPGIILDRVSNNNFASTMMLRKARSLSPAIAVISGDILGSYVAAGFNGSDFGGPNSGMTIRATQTWTSAANGSEILFRNIANDATNFAYHMGIYQNGRVGIADDAGTSIAYAKLHVNASGGVASGMTAMNGDGIALTGNHFYFENPASTSGQRVFSFANTGGVLTINANTNDASATAPSTLLPGAIALKATNGYVGINTNNPSNQLHVASTADPLRLEGLQAGTSADSILTINNGGVVKYRLLSDIGNGNFWNLTGNSGTNYNTNFLGTTDNVSLRFRTNNTEQMIIDSLGSVGIGSSAFNAVNKEKLLVDYGTTTSNTLANLKGNIDGYFQVNLQNRSNGTSSSSDYVATSNDGTDSTYYVDLGINGGNYVSSEDNWGGPHDAYLYTYGRNLVIGSQTTNGDVLFLLGGGRSKYNAVLRLDGITGNLVVGKGENQNNATGNIIRGPNGGSATNIPGGSLTLQGGSSNGNTAGGSLNLYGGGTVSGTYGSVNINTSTNSATNINTGTSASNITMGGTANNILLPKFSTVGGMYYTSVNTGQLSTTGSNMTWDSINNRLGIGLSNPGYKLSVLSASNPLYLSGVQATSSFSTDSILTILNGVVKKAPYSSLPSGGSSGWALTGNSGTNSTINFLGTTDAQPLVIKSLNRQLAYFDGNLYSIALGFGAVNGSSDHNVAIGYNATTNNQYTLALGYNATATGVRSVAIGNGGSATTASGAEAVAIGYNAISSAAQTVSLGYQATASGLYGVALGYSAQATASQSTAIGYSSLASAQYSNAIGYQAQATATQSTAIGYHAQTSQSNTILLGDVSTPGLRVGIGTATPSAKLDIVATSGNNPLEMTGLPTGVAGTDNILTINSSGIVGYVTPTSLNGSYWNLSGNAATSGSFLGTTNTTPLQFKFNSTAAGYLDANNTSFGTSSASTSGTSNTSIGYSATASNSSTAVGANAVASQASNTAIGNSATANISSQATAIGASSQALYQYNVAVGYNAQATSTSQETVVGSSAQAQGQNNIAIGYSAKANGSDKITVIGSSAQASFQNNTVVGYGATATTNNQATTIGALSDASAQNATALGYNASATGTNSTAIGYNTLASGTNSTVIGTSATTSQNNAIVLGTSTTNVGIGTSTPNTSTKLDVAGSFKLGSSGSVLSNFIKTTVAINPGSMSAGSTVTTTATVTGAATGNSVIVNPRSALPTGVIIAYSYISAANTLTVVFTSAVAADPPNTTFDITLIQ